MKIAQGYVNAQAGEALSWEKKSKTLMSMMV